VLDGENVIVGKHSQGRNQLAPPLRAVAIAAGAEYPTAVALLSIGLGVEHAGARQVGGINLRVFGVHMEDRAFEHAHGREGIDILPEEMTGIEVATQVRSGDRAQSEQGLRIVDHESGVHFDGDLHAVIGSEAGVLDPVRRDHFVPLPIQHLQEVWRPGARHPVGGGGVGRIARTSGEVDHHRDAELLGQQYGLAGDFAIVLRMRLIRMERIPVTTQGTDADAVIGHNLLELTKRGGILEHRELAVRIAGIVSGSKLYGINLQGRKFLENRGQRQLGQQGCEDANAHNDFLSPRKSYPKNETGHSTAAAVCYLNAFEGDHLRHTRIATLLFLPILFFSILATVTAAQNQPAVDPSVPPPPREKKIHLKRVLVISQTKGFEHDSISDAMAAIYNMGVESGLWETTLRTDTELITKKNLDRNAKNLDYFDALVFVSTTGELDLDDSQKKDMMSFIKDDGKGFVGVHAALDTNYKWPEYGEMIGGWFDQHPWFTFNAPIINEDPGFPAVSHFPHAFVKWDEIYQPKEWSRDQVNVLLSLDPTKLNYANNPRIHRTDHDFAVAWDKMYGKGRVFYSTLGHTQEAWTDPDIRKMYFEAIKWVLGMTDGSTASHPRLQTSGDGH
jgi:type 1 glutamine amidotransferase